MSDYDTGELTPDGPELTTLPQTPLEGAQSVAQLTGAVPAPVAEIDHYGALWRLAQRVAGTEMVPKALRGKPEGVLAVILYGEEIGLPPMTSLQSIHMIQGRPSMGAAQQLALVRRAGHHVEIVEHDEDCCTLVGRRTDGTEATVSYSIEDAQRAGLMESTNWQQYPRQMLLARASTELVRALFSDVLIAYDPEELS